MLESELGPELATSHPCGKETADLPARNIKVSPERLESTADTRRVVSIATAFDDNYVPCFAACLASLTEIANAECYYDIIVLADKISEPYRDLLAMQIRNVSNIAIRYIDMPTEFAKLEAVHFHFTKATFFRLKLADLLPLHEKVIYLDPDTIVLDDISQLSDIDISDFYAAAVPEYTMQIQIVENWAIPDAFGGTLKKYWDAHLQLSQRAQKGYFNAGVMIFNLAKIREENLIERFEELFWSQNFYLLDQDILNKVFDGQVFYLDQRWNVITVPIRALERLPFRLYEDYLQARRNPAVLHFAGTLLKPWKTENVDFAEYFWLFARKSPFYEIAHQSFIRTWLLNRQQAELKRKTDFRSRIVQAIAKYFRRSLRRA